MFPNKNHRLPDKNLSASMGKLQVVGQDLSPSDSQDNTAAAVVLER